MAAVGADGGCAVFSAVGWLDGVDRVRDVRSSCGWSLLSANLTRICSTAHVLLMRDCQVLTRC
jgi:hypothetical protein